MEQRWTSLGCMTTWFCVRNGRENPLFAFDSQFQLAIWNTKPASNENGFLTSDFLDARNNNSMVLTPQYLAFSKLS